MIYNLNVLAQAAGHIISESFYNNWVMISSPACYNGSGIVTNSSFDFTCNGDYVFTLTVARTELDTDPSCILTQNYTFRAEDCNVSVAISNLTNQVFSTKLYNSNNEENKVNVLISPNSTVIQDSYNVKFFKNNTLYDQSNHISDGYKAYVSTEEIEIINDDFVKSLKLVSYDNGITTYHTLDLNPNTTTYVNFCGPPQNPNSTLSNLVYNNNDTDFTNELTLLINKALCSLGFVSTDYEFDVHLYYNANLISKVIRIQFTAKNAPIGKWVGIDANNSQIIIGNNNNTFIKTQMDTIADFDRIQARVVPISSTVTNNGITGPMSANVAYIRNQSFGTTVLNINYNSISVNNSIDIPILNTLSQFQKPYVSATLTIIASEIESLTWSDSNSQIFIDDINASQVDFYKNGIYNYEIILNNNTNLQLNTINITTLPL